MSKKKNTGGAAFPQPISFSAPGMPLRDYLAAKAMAALIYSANMHAEYVPEMIADDAYLMADAMLKAREQ